jgi:hypothetical protein
VRCMLCSSWLNESAGSWECAGRAHRLRLRLRMSRLGLIRVLRPQRRGLPLAAAGGSGGALRRPLPCRPKPPRGCGPLSLPAPFLASAWPLPSLAAAASPAPGPPSCAVLRSACPNQVWDAWRAYRTAGRLRPSKWLRLPAPIYYYLLPLCTSRSRSHGLSRFLCKCYYYHREQPAASSPPLIGEGKPGSILTQLQLGLPTTCPLAGR